MKNYCVTILVFFILSSCATLKLTTDNLRGTYAQVEKAGYKFGIDLILNKGTFALVDHHDYRKNEYNPYRCCDTIAFGVWKLDENHMTVDFSTPDYSYTVLSSNLKEEVDSIKKDSIVFMITNPIEKKLSKKHEDIEYNVSLFTKNPYNEAIIGNFKPNITMAETKNLKFKTNLGDSVSDVIYDTNTISIPNPDHAEVRSFWVNILVNPGYSGRDISVNRMLTKQYTVTNRKSNVFKIDIPDLNYGFITYKRFESDLAKIINNDTLEWHGLKYVRIK